MGAMRRPVITEVSYSKPVHFCYTGLHALLHVAMLHSDLEVANN